MKFSIKDFLSKFARIWSQLLKKSLRENFIFCAVRYMKQGFVTAAFLYRFWKSFDFIFEFRNSLLFSKTSTRKLAIILIY